jgi:WD40 repeat protein
MNSDPALRAIFNEALDRPDAAARTRYLDEACGADAALRERVEKLLRADEAAGGFFSDPHSRPQASTSAASTVLPSASVTEKAGDHIGRYKLLQQIGEGGCGVVYMAEQEEPVRRRVALKVIKLGMDTRQVIARFEAERQALALMGHPNIAQVFDAGATDSGRPFFVMELVRGAKITEFCDQRTLSPRERLELFIPVCHAIQHAHQKGIVHRDLKPSNILVTIIDGVPVPKVIDFGIAKATNNQPLTDKTVFTAFDQFIGTPAYMSPEQAELSGVDIDTRTDIYSLGVVLYELLTGRTPFDSGALLRGGLDEIRRTIREQEPPKPSTRLHTLAQADLTTVAQARHTDAPRLVHLLQGDLDWVVMKCLDKDRNRRYETVNALAMDVQRHLGDDPVLARPPTAAYRLQKLVRRNKLAFAAAGAVIAALTIGLGVSLWLFVRETKAYNRAVAAESLQNRLREDAERAREGEAIERKRAEDNEIASRQNLYAADINLAQQAINAGNLGHARGLLASHRPAPGWPDLRGFEWRYFRGAAQGDNLATLRGHSNVVASIAISPDGKTILSCSQDRTVRLWELASHRLISTLTNFQDPGRSVAFSPDGKVFAAGGWGKRDRVTLWDATRLRLLATLDGQYSSVAFAPKGNLLAYGSSRGFFPDSGEDVRIWDYSANREVARIPGGGARVAFSPDARLLALGGQNDAVILYDIVSQQSVGRLPKAAAVQSMAFTPDGKGLVVAYWEGELLVWDLAGQRVLTELAGHSGRVWDMEFSPDGRILATASTDQTVRLWDVDTWQIKDILRGHGNEVWGVRFTPDGQTLVTGSKDETIMLWPVRPERPAALIQGVASAPLISQDASMLVAQDARGRVVLWDTTTAQPTLLSERPGMPLALLDGGKRLITVEPAGTVTSWDTESHSVQSQIALRESGEIKRAVLAYDPKTMATWSSGGQLRIYGVDDGEAQAAFDGVGAIFAFSTDQKHFVTTHGSQPVIWDRISGREIARLDGHQMGLSSLAIAPDGNTLVSGGHDGLIIVWDIRKQRALATLVGHEEGVLQVTVSPDGNTLASSSLRTVKLWHLPTFREVASFTLASQPPHFLAFSPDSRMFVMGGGKGPLHVLRAPSFAEIAAAEATQQQITR